MTSNLKLPIVIHACLIAGTVLAQNERAVPLQSAITQVQPMTGIALWSDNEIASKHRDAIALEFRYCGYDEVVNENGKYDFKEIDRVLDEISARGHQAILRFYFCYVGKETTVPGFIRNRADYRETVGRSEGLKTHFCDWTNQSLQDFTLEFYSRFAARYDEDPRIAFLQTGFGLWSEYHIYDGPYELGKTFPSKNFQAKFLQHLDQQFQQLPWSISIDAADNDRTPLEGKQELLALGFGVFDDSFLCKPHSRENAVNWKILGSNRWKRQPGGGEFSYYNKRDQRQALSEHGPNGVPFVRAAKQFHITYMIGNDQPGFRTMEEIKAAGMITGYRFRVTRASTENGALKLSVTNEGVAPIYRDAYFAAGNHRSASSLKGLLPGETLECVIPDIHGSDLLDITIQSDSILPNQTIQFLADLP